VSLSGRTWIFIWPVSSCSGLVQYTTSLIIHTTSRSLQRLPSKPVPVSKKLTLYPTCSSCGDLYKLIILSHFLLACTDPTPSYTPCLYQCPHPSAIHFTMQIVAAWSSEILVYYHITTHSYNSEDHDRSQVRSADTDESGLQYHSFHKLLFDSLPCNHNRNIVQFISIYCLRDILGDHFPIKWGWQSLWRLFPHVVKDKPHAILYTGSCREKTLTTMNLLHILLSSMRYTSYFCLSSSLFCDMYTYLTLLVLWWNIQLHIVHHSYNRK
jgi:hypothetical protein